MKSLIKEQIQEAVSTLFLKLQKLNIDNGAISEYNHMYLKKYIDNYSFYMAIYSQLLLKAINKLKKPVSESTFIDYGGGCGMLSYLSREIGFKTVVYNDIYQISVDDTKTISNKLDLKIDFYICGDIEEFINQINKENIKPDLICSFDVLEHIYNLEKWFKSLTYLKNEFSLIFTTNANPYNPIISHRLKKLQRKAEYKGLEKAQGWKEIDSSTSFLESREMIIRNKYPKLRDNEIELLSTKTRGLRKDDIENAVEDYIKTGKIIYQINHPTNTCDPYTGNWTENLINLEQLEKIVIKNNLTFNISNSFYSYSNNKILNIPKLLLNQIIRALGTAHLFFSPSYTLEIQKE
ncbi:MAG: methyltransferase domain-containing protein [Aureibaculum sp.]|nr:methyltransferase domain-containing protein [Aureibaculum sp.]